FRVEAAHPGNLYEGLSKQELACRAIQYIEHSIAIGPEHYFARFTLPLDVGEDRNLSRVKIEFVMRRKLVMPFQFTGIGVECHYRAGVQVVPWPRITVPVGPCVSGTPVNEI